MPTAPIFRLPGYAHCTPGVVEACVRAVAAEEPDLAASMPSFSSGEVAQIALNALEVAKAGGERHPLSASDWALVTWADAHGERSMAFRRRGNEPAASAARGDAALLVEQAAASSDRSPVLWYEDIYYEAARTLVRRGDRLGLSRQTECVAEALRVNGGGNVLSGVRDLADFHIQLGDWRAGLAMLTGLHRIDPSDPWSFNAIALRFCRFGLPSVAGLAAERGIELVRRDGDPERLEPQLGDMLRESRTAEDRSDAPVEAVAELREALQMDFIAGVAPSPFEIVERFAPAAATARVKALPPEPSAEAVRQGAADIRALLGWRDPRRKTPVSKSEPTIGRNQHCPCGSGKKYKKCHGNGAGTAAGDCPP